MSFRWMRIEAPCSRSGGRIWDKGEGAVAPAGNRGVPCAGACEGRCSLNSLCHCDLVCAAAVAAAMSLQNVLQHRGLAAVMLSSDEPWLWRCYTHHVSQQWPCSHHQEEMLPSPFVSNKANRKYSATLLPVLHHPFHCFLPLSILGEKCLRKLPLPQFRFRLQRQTEPSVSRWALPPPALRVEKRQKQKEDETSSAHNICFF